MLIWKQKNQTKPQKNPKQINKKNPTHNQKITTKAQLQEEKNK